MKYKSNKNTLLEKFSNNCLIHNKGQKQLQKLKNIYFPYYMKHSYLFQDPIEIWQAI